MSDKKLAHLRVAILASDGFEQAELEKPRKALEEAGAKTLVVAPKSGKIQGFIHDEKADKVDVDMTLDQADPDAFDAVLLPGGALNADFLRVEKKAQNFIRRIDQAKKPIAVICHAPWLLVSAGLVKGRTMTSYHTIQDDIRNAGGLYRDQPTVQDGHWISSRGAADMMLFNRAMLEKLAVASLVQPA